MKMQSRSAQRVSWGPLALTMSLAAGAAAPVAHAQWSVVNLHPSWAASSEARSVQNGVQVGFAGLAGQDALMWTGSADSAVILDPTPTLQAAAVCIDGHIQGGRAEVVVEGLPKQHAALWSGSAKTFVDLHPGDFASNSSITAAQGNVQGGVWFPVDAKGPFTLGRPCIWRGTPESFVDLTPPGVSAAEVHGVFGGEQVGANYDSFLAQACMWRGTPESYVSLQPATALFSTAECTDGVRQYGGILTWDGEDFATAQAVAGYWTGTADSWVPLSPPGVYGVISAADGDRQVGTVSEDPIGNGPYSAAIWAGTVESYENLQQYLPEEYTESWAYGVWTDPNGTTYVVGAAHNSVLDREEAVMWVSGVPCPADFNGSGEVNSQDFFDFLNAFFAQAPEADFNGDSQVNSQDFFEFLTAFFDGC